MVFMIDGICRCFVIPSNQVLLINQKSAFAFSLTYWEANILLQGVRTCGLVNYNNPQNPVFLLPFHI